MQQVTLIIPFTKLDAMVETKIENNNMILVLKINMVHCYIKPIKCLFIAQKMKYYVSESNAEMDGRWLDVIITIKEVIKK